MVLWDASVPRCYHRIMSKIISYDIDVLFGDCDPAGIVFFPNFLKWMDASSLNFFMQCGLPPWRDWREPAHLIGTPLLEIQTRFNRPATYGQTLTVHTEITDFSRKTFTHRHQVMRGEELICEGTEVRAFCTREPETGVVRAIALPEIVLTHCR